MTLVNTFFIQGTPFFPSPALEPPENALSNALVALIDGQQDQFKKVSCNAHGVEFEREKGFALQIIKGSDYLTKIALANPDSLRNAVTNLSAIGITLNPASKLAYLLPRKGGVCLDISYQGMMHIAQQSGAIVWGQAVIVRDTDVFRSQGIDKAPVHEFDPFDKTRGPVKGVYCIVKTDTGDYLTETMTIEQVFDIRDRSEAWKVYQKDNTKKCPWVTDQLEMVRKTVVKRASKYWPRRERLDQAIHYLNTDGGEGLAQEYVQNNSRQEPKDVTPSTPDQQIAIADKLREMKKNFKALNSYLMTTFKQSFESEKELTSAQATMVLALLNKP